MANSPIGVYYPVGTDDATNLQYTFQRLAESAHKTPTFATLTEATTWAGANPTYAIPGVTHVAINGKKYVWE